MTTLKMISGAAGAGAAALSEPCWASEPGCCSAFSALLLDAAGAEASATSAMAVNCSASHEGRGCNDEGEEAEEGDQRKLISKKNCFRNLMPTNLHSCVCAYENFYLLGSLSRFSTALHPT